MTSGVDPATISPADAAVALRSYPRRWRGAFAVVEYEEEGEELLRRGEPSAIELLGAACKLLEEAHGWLSRIQTSDEPQLGRMQPVPQGAKGSLDEFEAIATALAADVEAVPAEAWTRTGRLDDSDVTALDLVRRAVATVSDRLRQAERTLREQVGR